MDSKIIAAIIGVVGISIGALLGGVGYYLKSRNETMQTKNMVLYHLLELRHLLKSSYINPKEFADLYIEYCRTLLRKKGIDDENEFPENIKRMIEWVMARMLEVKKPNIDESFISSYKSALLQLCETDPVMAYKLKGKERLSEILNVQKEYSENFMTSYQGESSEEFNQFLEKQVDKAGNKVLLELIKGIDRDISLISRKCGLLTWIDCKRLTTKKEKPSVDFKKMGLDEWLENALSDSKLNVSEGISQ